MKFRIILIVLSVFLFSACSSFSTPEETRSNDDYGSTSGQSEGLQPPFTNDQFSTLNKDSSDAMIEKLIQTIGLDLETKEYTKTVAAIEALTKTLNGYIQSSTVPRPRNDKEFSNLVANLSLMIPTSSIEEFILKVGSTSNIVNERRDVYNVSDVYRDTASRIVNLKAKEVRLLELLKQSGSLSDLLLIETELSNTRYEIERLESSIRDFDTRIEYTQFNLSIREVYEYSPSERASLWERLVDEFSRNAQRFLRALESGFIFIVTTLPFLLIELALWSLPILIIYFVFRKVSKKRNFKLWFKRKTSLEKKFEEKNESPKDN